jgi:hypothetical protein
MPRKQVGGAFDLVRSRWIAGVCCAGSLLPSTVAAGLCGVVSVFGASAVNCASRISWAMWAGPRSHRNHGRHGHASDIA